VFKNLNDWQMRQMERGCSVQCLPNPGYLLSLILSVLMLPVGAERMEAAEARLDRDLRKQGLVSEPESAEDINE